MTEKQKMRLDLYREFGSKAQEAYDFIMGGEADNNIKASESETLYSDGVYLEYEDHIEPFNGKNPKDGIKSVGVIMGNRGVAVSLSETEGEYSLTNRRVTDDNNDLFTKGKRLAMEDFNGEANTAYIKRIGTDIPLKDGEYIPSVGEMLMITMNLTKVNESLEYAGGDCIRKDWYWTSTSYSAAHAWCVNFSTGGVFSANKVSLSHRVRAVSAFLPF